VPGGSTGEFAALTLEERKWVNEIVIEQAAGRVPVAPQTGSTRTAEAIELSRHAADAGASAILLVQPFYEAPTRHEVIEYFATVGEAAGVPVIVYNLPGVTGMNLDRPFYRELLERTGVVKYVKDTSGSIEQAFDLIFNLGDAIDTFVGWDTIVLPVFSAGAAGSIWGAPNFAPRECRDLRARQVGQDCRSSGDLQAAVECLGFSGQGGLRRFDEGCRAGSWGEPRCASDALRRAGTGQEGRAAQADRRDRSQLLLDHGRSSDGDRSDAADIAPIPPYSIPS
jgi:dihydrodipicolinate synthase/N-acetylneuraminate lyase